MGVWLLQYFQCPPKHSLMIRWQRIHFLSLEKHPPVVTSVVCATVYVRGRSNSVVFGYRTSTVCVHTSL